MEGRGIKLRMSETVFSLSLLIEVFKRDPMVFIKKVKNRHGGTAGRASNRIITESRDDGTSPGSKSSKGFVFFPGDGSANASIRLAMASIETVITNHFEVFFGDVSDELFDKVQGRDGFMDKNVIFVSVVMESNSVGVLIVGIDTGSGDDGTAEIAADILQDSGSIALVVFGINIEAIFGVAVNAGFQTFEFGREFLLKEIQKDSLEGIAEESIVEVCNRTPKTEFIDAAFRDKTVDVGIPF